jgi:hypothetical protein
MFARFQPGARCIGKNFALYLKTIFWLAIWLDRLVSMLSAASPNLVLARSYRDE